MASFVPHAKTVISFMRLRAFDAQTAEGRSKERYRRATLTTLTSVAAKGISLVAMLVTVPLTLRYLGMERYALWMTVSSTISMLSFTDLGVGNGLLTALSECNGKQDHEGAVTYVSTAFFLLAGIGALLGFGTFAIWPYVHWERIFSVSSLSTIKEAGQISAASIVCFALNMPLGVIQRVQMGYQQGFVSNCWVALGSVLSLGALLIAMHLQAGLLVLVICVAGAPLVPALVNGWLLFGVTLPSLRPRWSAVQWMSASRLLRLGIYFLLLQTSVVVPVAADNLIIAHLLNARAVAEYSVTIRIFTVLPLALSMLLVPLWPAYGESVARGEFEWARKTLRKSLTLVAASTTAAGLLLVVFGVWILHLWVGPTITPSFALMAGMAVWMVLSSSANAISVFLNGTDSVRVQVVSACAMACCALTLKFILIPRIGSAGAIWATNVAYIVCVWVPVALFLPGFLSQLRTRKQANEQTLASAPACAGELS